MGHSPQVEKPWSKAFDS